MPTVNNVQSLRKWLRGCPVILRENYFRVDYISENPTEYSLFAVPSTIAYHENVLGEFVPNDIQSVNFIFASKEPFGADEKQNMENLGFYQDVVAWIIQQNSIRNLPQISEGRVLSVVPTLTPYRVDADANSAKYQIQIRLTYRRR